MRHHLKFIAIALCCLMGAPSLMAQSVSTISVDGEVLRPLHLSVKDIEKLHPVELKAKDKAGKEHTYRGAMLASVLDSAGVTLGADLRGENLAKYVSIKAVDGYEVLFSLVEVDPEFSSQQVLLATMVDGNPLPPGEGPFRIVAPQEKKPTRWIRAIVSIQVKSARK
jgi:DMSO/TMAO reductase YedYZ molybdopterin-dependent catalytic subunit